MNNRDRHFTLQEAQDLVPWLQATLDAIEPRRKQLARAKREIRRLTATMRSNGGVQAEKRMGQAQQDAKDAETAIEQYSHAIVERGILLRSVERGLVDFPSMKDGRFVYLCWLWGESEIAQWHELDAGFDGRQPL